MPQYVIERLGGDFGARVGLCPRRRATPNVGRAVQSATNDPTVRQLRRPRQRWAIPCRPAMGAKVAEPDRVVWAIDGDGCFQMTNQELATCVINNIPIKVVVINNSSLGMVRQWQTLFYNERYSATDLHTSVGSRIPDFVKLADAGGCRPRCESPRMSTRRSARRWRSTTCLSSSTSSSNATRWSGPWLRPA